MKKRLFRWAVRSLRSGLYVPLEVLHKLGFSSRRFALATLAVDQRYLFDHAFPDLAQRRVTNG